MQEESPVVLSANDRQAQVDEFVRCVRDLSPRILRMYGGISRQLLLDGMQDAFEKVYRKIDSGVVIGNMRGYLHQACINEIRSGLRRQKTRNEVTGAGGPDAVGQDSLGLLERLLDENYFQNDIAPGIIELDCIHGRVIPYFQDRDPRVLQAISLSVQGYAGRSQEMIVATGMKTAASANDFLGKAWQQFKDVHSNLCEGSGRGKV